jgi:uncharacterized LabA/DUF88 family protein
MKVSLFIDLSDLYHGVNKKFGRKLSYAKTLSKILEYFGEAKLGQLHAYGVQKQNEASGFISCLRNLGFETHFSKPKHNWDVDIVADALHSKSEIIVIGTNNVSFLKFHGLHFLTLDSRLMPQITITEEFLECHT